MTKSKGKLFVIEGGEGTGKTVQYELLIARLEKEGYPTARADFPRYGDSETGGNPASFFVRKYLQKKEFGFSEGYGKASGVNPYAASLFYALDRFDAAFCHEQRPNLWDLLNEGKYVVSNRYTQSNIGFQASKIEDRAERARFIEQLTDLEYRVLEIPRPDLVILLDLDPEVALELKTRQRKEQGLPLDAHESDFEIITKARNAYLEAAKLFPESWVVVGVGTKVHPAAGNPLAGIHSRELIHEKIWAKVKPFLSR